MSGGHFDYLQYRIREIANQIEQLIRSNNDAALTEYGDPKGHNYAPNTVTEFERGIEFLCLAKIYAQRIDWLVSGDDDEESFHTRLKEDLVELHRRTVL